MQLVDRPVLAPAICGVCERSWQPDDSPWVDTLSTFDVGVVTFLTGRKYVCGHCAARMALLLGFTPPEDFASMVAKLKEIESMNAELQGRISDLVVIERALTRLAESLAVADASND